jgi:hypothetical protein
VHIGETQRRPLLSDLRGVTCVGEDPGPPSCNDLSCNGAGACNNDNRPDASECATPATCPAAFGPLRCSTADLPAPYGLPNGCLPPLGRCLVTEGPFLSCSAAGSTQWTNVCAVCDPARNPWGYSPRYDAAPCNDENPCTTNDRCDGASSGPPEAICYGGGPAPNGTACNDGFDCSYGADQCVAGLCRPTACIEELCGAPNCP